MAGKDHYHVNPQRAVDRHTLITGTGYSVAKTRAQLNRETRQAEMRKKIEASGYETHVANVVKKLLDPELEFDSIEVQRMKSAADLSIKMMAKFMPDMKSTEITGPDGGDLVIAVQRKRFDGED
jgi:predicted ATPase